MATEKTDFLKFNAYSMKELITRKMSEDSKFTDQIYEGSNLAILIDLVAYMYQCLVYQLNNAASESMFSDTQIYENISRLVKMIGYNPRGCKPAQLRVNIIRDEAPTAATVLKYSRIDTGLTDSRGETIYFSLPGMDSDGNSGTVDLETESIHTINLINGQWKLYPQIFTASGVDYETFTLNSIKSDSSEQKYVADGYLDVYIKRGGKFIEQFFADSEELLLGQTNNAQSQEIRANRLYNTESKVFSVRLNERKEYEIKFGDGTTGEKLKEGDQVYVFYLDSNGPDGEIDVGQVDFSNLKFQHNSSIFGLTRSDYTSIFETRTKTLITDADYQLAPYSPQTTSPSNEQSVDEIRETAPRWFKTGNRLLTRSDYEFFVKSNIPEVIDVKCMNNWEYLATFYKWLFDCGVRYHQDASNPGRYYFTEDKFLGQGMDMVDAADANNIYLWIKSQSDTTIDQIRQELMGDQSKYNMNYLKILTSELQFLKPLPVLFDIGASYQDVAQSYAKNGDFETFISKTIIDSYLEITLDEECIYVNSFITNKIIQIFSKYFNQQNLKIGQNIDTTKILDDIYAIGGVNRVRTVFVPSTSYQEYDATLASPKRAIDGISFISWTNGFIDYGEDVQIGNVSRHLQPFQFPQFNGVFDSTFAARIKIIKKQLTNISNIKF